MLQHFLCLICVITPSLIALNTDYAPDSVEAKMGSSTFQLRYFKNTKSFKKGGPLFVYIGGQYSLEKLDSSKIGVLHQIAPNFNAKIVVVEHRFYGKSNPYGETDTSAYTDISKLQNLDIEQVLEDVYAVVAKESSDMVHNAGEIVHPFVFGIGYSGLLAALYNYKYQDDGVRAPAGGWVSSVHLKYSLLEEKSYYSYDTDLTTTFSSLFDCKPTAVSEALEALKNYDETRYAELEAIFGLEKGGLISREQVNQLLLFCVQTIRDIASVNYPYPVELSNKKVVPQWPAQIFCNNINAAASTDKAKVEALRNALFTAFLNPSPPADADTFKLNFDRKSVLENRDLSEEEMRAKTWQHCSQLVYGKCAAMQANSNNFFSAMCKPTDMLDYTKEVCNSMLASFVTSGQYDPSVHYKPNYIAEMFGVGYKNAADKPLCKKMVFARGSWDGYASTNAVNVVKEHECYAFNISAATTGLDFSEPNTCDPESMAEARTQIVDILECWIRGTNAAERCAKKEAMVELTRSGKEFKEHCEVSHKGWPWRTINYPDKDVVKPEQEVQKEALKEQTSHANGLLTSNTLLFSVFIFFSWSFSERF